MRIKVVAIDRDHARKPFSCGDRELDFFLRKYAIKNEGVNGRTYVAVDSSETVAGYVTLAAGELSTVELPDDFRSKLPRYPVPVVLIAKLAVATSFQGRGVGARLLLHAARRALSVAKQVGCHGLYVDALNEDAKGFYLHYGFISSPARPLRLFLPMETINAAARRPSRKAHD